MPQERQNPIARELEQARGLYQKKDYIQALARFTNIINTYADPPLKAFDGRAAVHIKLGNHPAALQDGKRMIHLAKKDAKGYFRAGQVLELMDKKDIAASIYEYGLRQIPANDPSYQMLQGLHNKMVNECATLRAVDPLTRLPLEIVLQIFRYLKFPQHVNLLRVCKNWKSLSERLPEIWQHLVIIPSKSRKPPHSTTLTKYLKLSQYTLTDLKISPVSWNLSFGGLCKALRACSNLKILDLDLIPIERIEVSANIAFELSRLRSLTSIILGENTHIRLTDIAVLLDKLSHLVSVDIRAVGGPKDSFRPDNCVWKGISPALRRLRLDRLIFLQPLKGLQLETLVKRCPMLEYLSLDGWLPNDPSDLSFLTTLRTLREFRLDPNFQSHLPSLPSTLQKLELSSHRVPYQSGSQPHLNVTTSTDPRPDLSVLELRRLRFRSIEDYTDLTKGHLRSLCIASTYQGAENEADYQKLAKLGYFKSLEILDISRCPFGDDLAKSLSVHAPMLQSVNASYSAITGIGVKALVQKKGKSLVSLTVQACENLSLDAIAYARGKGIDVSHKLQENSSGRKVRT